MILMKDENTEKEGKYTESSLANQGDKKSNKRSFYEGFSDIKMWV